jgi:excisionase family DNA binding protein
MDSVGTSESGQATYVSLAELAAELKVSSQTIYDLRSKGRGPRGFRIGTQLRFRKSEIDAWVSAWSWPTSAATTEANHERRAAAHPDRVW